MLIVFQCYDILPHQISVGVENAYVDSEFLPYQSSQASDDGHATRLHPEVIIILLSLSNTYFLILKTIIKCNTNTFIQLKFDIRVELFDIRDMYFKE